jgi:adenine phosphoribosyltransferase
VSETETEVAASGGPRTAERHQALAQVWTDFKDGVRFRDIMPILADAEAFAYARDRLVEWARPLRPDYIAAVDARGFIFGGVLASSLDCGFLAVRKEGKLPGPIASTEFAGEYSTDKLFLRTDLLPPGARVIVHDDLMATGNCLRTVSLLVERLGGEVVGVCSLVEKAFLGGRKQVSDREFMSVFSYDS